MLHAQGYVRLAMHYVTVPVQVLQYNIYMQVYHLPLIIAPIQIPQWITNDYIKMSIVTL